MGAATDPHRALVVRLGGRLGAIGLDDVIETMRPLPIDPLAGAPAFVMGVSMIRGEPVPVVDAAALVGGSGGAPTRLVTVRVGAGKRVVALAVDAVLGVRVLAASTMRDLPPLLRDAGSEVVGAIGTLDAELLLVLDASHLLVEDLGA